MIIDLEIKDELAFSELTEAAMLDLESSEKTNDGSTDMQISYTTEVTNECQRNRDMEMSYPDNNWNTTEETQS